MTSPRDPDSAPNGPQAGPDTQPTADSIAELVRAGRHEQAAELAQAKGQIEQALLLFEKVWRFDKAWPLAETLQDWPRAVKLALEARDPQQALRLAAHVKLDDKGTLARIADAFAGRGQFETAARFAEHAADLPRAADLYRRAGLPLAAAGVLVKAGRLRDAARLLETIIATADPASGVASSAERAEAELVMGKLMARLGRPWDAARALQNAVQHPATRVEARRHLCGVLLELGLRHAAEETARRLTREDPASPPNALAVSRNLPADARDVPERFTVERLLGAGGTGRVYLALDRLLGRAVAIKALSVGATGAEEQALARFVREAEAAGRLRHPNIVALHDVDLSAGLLVFEYVSGGSLAQQLQVGPPLPLAKVRRLALDLLDALAAAHEAGIVHRDVKPANIFFDAAGSAKLGDFGAAHLLDFGQTQTGGLIGTLAYLSPEQVTGDRIGPSADLYGLAATLFEALTGRPPFLGPDFVTQHLAEPPPSPSALAAGACGDAAELVDAVLLRALAKAPQDRYASTGAMAEAVAAWPIQIALDAPVLKRRAPEACDPPTPPAPPTSATAHTLGRAGAGTLREQRDVRTERMMVVWQPDKALAGPELQRVRNLAALGGPNIQRIFSLADEAGDVGATVGFEALPGEQVPLDQIQGNQRAQLEQKLAQVAVSAPELVQPPRIVDIGTGFVILLQPPLDGR